MSKKRNDRKAIRREQAEERLASWQENSFSQRLRTLKFRPGKAAKQTAKLRAKL